MMLSQLVLAAPPDGNAFKDWVLGFCGVIAAIVLAVRALQYWIERDMGKMFVHLVSGALVMVIVTSTGLFMNFLRTVGGLILGF